MFVDQYVDSQPYACKTIKNFINNNKVSHAYIVESNGYTRTNEFIKAFVKDLLCIGIDDESKKSNISLQIDNDEYIELEIIRPTSLEIKKEQVLKLQSSFKNKAITGNKKIYIIEEADKFNDSSSNTILKFLEEPEENIIAILVVNNRFSLLDTIISRCQLISLIEDNDKDIKDLIKIDDINKEEFIDNFKRFIFLYEKNKKKTLLYEKSSFLSYFNNRDKVLCAFDIMKYLYLDALKSSLGLNTKYFRNDDELIDNICKNNSTKKIIEKIDIIIKCIDRLNSYVNTNMLLDYFIIETCR